MLASKDATKLVAVLQRLYQQTDAAKLPATAVSVLASLVPSAAAAFNVIHEDHRVEITHNARSLDGEVARRTWALEKHIDQHPLENFFRKTGSPEPVRISDFLSRKKFHDLALYQEFYKSLGVEYQISAFLRQIDEFARRLRHSRASQSEASTGACVLNSDTTVSDDDADHARCAPLSLVKQRRHARC